MFITNKKYVLSIVTISLAVGFLIHFPEILSLTDPVGRQMLFPEITPMDVFFEVAYTFISLLVLFAINTFLFGFNHPSIRMTWKKVTLSFIAMWFFSKMLGALFVYLHHYMDIPAIDALVHQYLHPVRDLIISLIVTGTCYIYYLIAERQIVLMQNGKLLAENIQNQYQALKNQLNPHMLFNSLNTLQSLVRENPDKALNYIYELSRVLRYTLQENSTPTVSLREEMDFVKAYIFLMQMRYEDNLHFVIDIDPFRMDYQLPPLSVQTLVENAIKHNEISKRKPLTIGIKTVETGEKEDLFLCVENNLQLRRTPYSGMGVGLANLSKRYQLLFGKEILIEEKTDCFSVSIPLVKQHKAY